MSNTLLFGAWFFLKKSSLQTNRSHGHGHDSAPAVRVGLKVEEAGEKKGGKGAESPIQMASATAKIPTAKDMKIE